MNIRTAGWAKHYQAPYLEDARKPAFPLWLRVAFVAFGLHERNGHACLARGELRGRLTTVNLSTGEVVEPRADAISRAIRQAKELGLLASESNAYCLVVPQHRIEGGTSGTPYAPCRYHDARRQLHRPSRPGGRLMRPTTLASEDKTPTEDWCSEPDELTSEVKPERISAGQRVVPSKSSIDGGAQ